MLVRRCMSALPQPQQTIKREDRYAIALCGIRELAFIRPLFQMAWAGTARGRKRDETMNDSTWIRTYQHQASGNECMAGFLIARSEPENIDRARLLHIMLSARRAR